MKTKLDYERNASIGFFRNISILLGSMLLGFALCFMCGCSTIRSIATDENIRELAIEQLDRLADKWVARMEKLPPVITPEPGKPEPGKPATTTGDEVSYNSLQWLYGGFKASGAVIDRVTLSNLSCDGRNVRYNFVVGLDVWGLGHSDAGAICAVFIQRPDGSWQGGKFDWVSTSRPSRELKHLKDYSGWHETLPVRGKVAFVVVSADGKRRSNVIIAEAK